MNRAWMPPALLVALVALLSTTAGGQPKPNAKPPEPDTLRLMLEKKGYVAVPLTQEEGGGFMVECKIGIVPCRLLLDTGAESSVFDIALVKRLGLKQGDEVGGVGIGGVQKGVEISLRGISIGDFDTRAMTGSLYFKAFDLSAMNDVRDQRKLRRIDGLLGHSGLKHASAVVDYSARTLYLRTPLNGLWPEIDGRWVATEGQEDGRARRIDPLAPPRLEFKDRRLQLTDGTKRYTFGVHVQPAKGGHALALFDPERELAEELDYTAGGLLKVSDGRLTVCLCLDPATSEGMPDEFKAPADSGRLLLEFRREK